MPPNKDGERLYNPHTGGYGPANTGSSSSNRNRQQQQQKKYDRYSPNVSDNEEAFEEIWPRRRIKHPKSKNPLLNHALGVRKFTTNESDFYGLSRGNGNQGPHQGKDEGLEHKEHLGDECRCHRCKGKGKGKVLQHKEHMGDRCQCSSCLAIRRGKGIDISTGYKNNSNNPDPPTGPRAMRGGGAGPSGAGPSGAGPSHGGGKNTFNHISKAKLCFCNRSICLPTHLATISEHEPDCGCRICTRLRKFDLHPVQDPPGQPNAGQSRQFQATVEDVSDEDGFWDVNDINHRNNGNRGPGQSRRSSRAMHLNANAINAVIIPEDASSPSSPGTQLARESVFQAQQPTSQPVSKFFGSQAPKVAPRAVNPFALQSSKSSQQANQAPSRVQGSWKAQQSQSPFASQAGQAGQADQASQPTQAQNLTPFNAQPSLFQARPSPFQTQPTSQPAPNTFGSQAQNPTPFGTTSQAQTQSNTRPSPFQSGPSPFGPQSTRTANPSQAPQQGKPVPWLDVANGFVDWEGDIQMLDALLKDERYRVCMCMEVSTVGVRLLHRHRGDWCSHARW